MKHKKLYAFMGSLIFFGTVIVLLLQLQRSEAQTGGPILLEVSDINAIEGLSSNNPSANYPPPNPSYAGQEISYDNEGISIFIAPSSLTTPITTDGNVPECGHLGIQEWRGANYAYKLFSNPSGPFANQWEKRRSPCNGIVVIGSSGQIRAQTLTLRGTSVSGQPFTLQINVPDPTLWDREIGGGSRRLYIDNTGAAYSCYSSNFTRIWPNECEFSPQQALQRAPVSQGSGARANDGLCQPGENSVTHPQDCPDTTPPVISAIFGVSSLGSTTITWATNEDSDSTVEHGSNMNLGETALNPTLNLNHTVRLNVGLTYGNPYYYRVKSRDGAGNIATSDIQTLLIPVPPIACADSDGGMIYGQKGTTTGIYAGGTIDYHAIYGQEPNPTTPKSTTNNYSTYIDHCASTTQINEGFCDTQGRISAIGYQCPNGCQNGICLPAPEVPPPSTTNPSLIGWWKFDGNGNNEVSGRPAAITVGRASFNSSGGKLGGYAYIPGSSDYVKIPYNRVFDLPDTFTVEFWFRQRADQSFNQDFVYKGNGQNNYNFKIFRYLWNQYNSGAVIAGHTAANTGFWTQASNPNQLEHGVWHHVLYTKSATAQTYYLDGNLVHTKDFTQYPEYGGHARTPQTDIIIGDSAVDTDIDNLKIYNRALSANEVSQIGGFPTPNAPSAPSGLVANVAGNGADVNLTWTDNSNNESGFNVYRKIASGNMWTLDGSTGPNTTAYTDMYISAGAYEYKITAYLTNGGTNLESTPSNTYGVVTTGISNGSTTVGTTVTGTNTILTPPPVTPPIILPGTNTPWIGTTTIPPTPRFCGMAITRAYNPSTNECRDFSNTCIPEGWVAQQCENARTAVLDKQRVPDTTLPPQTPEISAQQCKQYLANLRSSLNNDQQFWRDVRNQLKNAPADYPDRRRIEELLAESKNIITAVAKLIKKGKCESDLIFEIQRNQQKLRTEIFSELSSYLPEMYDYAALEQCTAGLRGKISELKKLQKKISDGEKQKTTDELIERITNKLQEFRETADNLAAYEASLECREFEREVIPQITPLQRAGDKDLNRIISDVVEAKLSPVIEKLKDQLKEEGGKINELLVQVAQMHKAVENISQSASAISEKITISYTALTNIEERFERERTEIQNTKARLMPLVENALQVMKEKRCVPTNQQEPIVQEFGTMASVNWFSEKADELERRLNLFITGCRSKDIAKSDIEALRETVSKASEDNQRLSYKKGVTPFPDVPTHEWYYGGMLTSYRNGFLTQGKPAESVLRQDALLMLLRMAGVTDEELTGECDIGPMVVNVSPYARCGVKTGQKRGLTFRGDMSLPVQRGEVAKWITELNLVPPAANNERINSIMTDYADLRAIDRTWRDPIARLVEAGVMIGVITDESKRWQPNEPLTRAALAVVLDQLFKMSYAQAAR